MKKRNVLIVLVALFGGIALAGCFKNDTAPSCTGYTLEQDRHVIDSFLSRNGQTPNFTYDNEHGWYYGITTQGAGNVPASDSLVAWAISAKLLSGIEYASTSAATATNSLAYYSQDPILGFALPKLKEGGVMRVIIPSSRLYGCGGASNSSGVKVVPANSQIIYDITLTDVKKVN